MSYHKIGLLDHMGYGNLGDAAIQESVISNIRKRLPNTVFVGFSSNPDDTRRRHNIDSFPLSWSYQGSDKENVLDTSARYLVARLKKVIKKCRAVHALAKPFHDLLHETVHLLRSYCIVRSLDLLIISGGGQLCELWGGPWAAPYNVFKFCLLARLSRTPVIILNVGVSPLKYRLSRFFAKWAVRLSDYASFRDRESQVLLASLGVKSRTHVFPDLAYGLVLPEVKSEEHSGRGKLVVGLNPKGFCDPRLWPRKDFSVYSRYLDKLTSFSSWLLSRGFALRIFTNDPSTDGYAIEDLQERLRAAGRHEKELIVATVPARTVSELIRQLMSFDFVVTSKFHGVVFSHMVAKPVIALSYQPKMDNLMRAVGHERYCMDIEHFDVGWLKETFDLLVENSDNLKVLFRETAERYAAVLQTQFDELFATGGNLCRSAFRPR